MLGLMGFPKGRLECTRSPTDGTPPPTRTLADLAGNAFSLYALAPVVLAAFICIDFSTDPPAPAAEGPALAQRAPVEHCVLSSAEVESLGSQLE